MKKYIPIDRGDQCLENSGQTLSIEEFTTDNNKSLQLFELFVLLFLFGRGFLWIREAKRASRQSLYVNNPPHLWKRTMITFSHYQLMTFIVSTYFLSIIPTYRKKGENKLTMFSIQSDKDRTVWKYVPLISLIFFQIIFFTKYLTLCRCCSQECVLVSVS